MKLPKLYRKVWLKIEWLKDECVNGEHEQTGGDIYIEAKRVKNPDNTWFWQMSKWDIEENLWELRMAGYFDGEGEFMYDVSYDVRTYFNERDLGFSYNRPTIKKQLEQKERFKELENLPL